MPISLMFVLGKHTEAATTDRLMSRPVKVNGRLLTRWATLYRAS